MSRSRVHQVVLETAGPTESLVLGAIAKHFECGIEHLPAALVADVRAALMRGLRPVFEELARRVEMPPPIADLLEPPTPPPVPQSQRPTAPPPAGYDWLADDEVTPLEEAGYERRLTGDMTRLLPDRTPTGRTIPSMPPPPPPPDVLSSHLKRRP